MAVSLGKRLLRGNRKWPGRVYPVDKGRSISGGILGEVGDVQNLIDPPLREDEDYPSYVQPNEKSSSARWAESWQKTNVRGNEEKEKRGYYGTHPVSDNPAYTVPYRYKVVIPTRRKKVKGISDVNEQKKGKTNLGGTSLNEPNDPAENIKEEYSRDVSDQLSYSDFVGFRNPTLETLDNYRYWQDSGFKKFLHRTFPIKLPEHKKLNPLFREYIYFLHSMDPFRFSVKKLSERYFLSQKCIESIYKEESVKRFLRENQLCDEDTKRISKKEAVLKIKELIYAKKLGYKDIGDFENVQNEDDQFQGHKNTFDVINRQVIQVESISAFPLPDRRDPVPKRVDVDIPVGNSANVKIMNWVNPNDKVVF
ncbi:conserved Plasmodium protein, unknown function [Plasmodium knowlesi strain H]|uniref:Uncharacterized protein n=3 Tax=Plasmodium knowlesi TaxID=5850 RepID=A0A5K1U9W3_PLAKH|nr:uncharacterized protein PKNH_0208200 [Plasmodium knowlesi strain H]OTN66197.1 Uncharacterized protein PKNOH_S09518000 [Plasmodium knowlesi]CAA9986348.1 conserved protein, unknown function [Plasmodium knowlesi strain H]SBO25601.1 conserved Plasmodium protein, unknown function [Plasmodium knowlesi strain H]SBO28334.1 conserved Plasmodium protein, unknown function [Plasmodium knowlesi strain H]VVS75822.1 conserved protein, unknown function [Plasmodium knowlesi strain H]|eukprot:XP_002257753.1 [Plasmodium knowlesi strain H]